MAIWSSQKCVAFHTGLPASIVSALETVTSVSRATIQTPPWPIFFFGTHQISWIPESNLRVFEENRETLGKNKHIKEAMRESLANTAVKFQFGNGSGEIVPKMWDLGEAARRWFRFESDEQQILPSGMLTEEINRR
ncbi:unnamed protein product [Oikopleura dioica]|uniref:PWWP domain-containing protein n=1 Tax=Oikopleura dioica TaxID=34765 RepID=E4XG10_OIKDI|nr:unnamed protein product [Oikopleura dioica]